MQQIALVETPNNETWYSRKIISQWLLWSPPPLQQPDPTKFNQVWRGLTAEFENLFVQLCLQEGIL